MDWDFGVLPGARDMRAPTPLTTGPTMQHQTEPLHELPEPTSNRLTTLPSGFHVRPPGILT